MDVLKDPVDDRDEFISRLGALKFYAMRSCKEDFIEALIDNETTAMETCRSKINALRLWQSDLIDIWDAGADREAREKIVGSVTSPRV